MEPANTNQSRTESIEVFSLFTNGLKKMKSERSPSFDEMLDEAPLNIETKQPKKPQKQSPAKLARSGGVQGMENNEAPNGSPQRTTR